MNHEPKKTSNKITLILIALACSVFLVCAYLIVVSPLRENPVSARIVETASERYDANPDWFFVNFKIRIKATLQNYGDTACRLTLEFKTSWKEGSDYKIVTVEVEPHEFKTVTCDGLATDGEKEYSFFVKILKVEKLE